MNRTAVVEIVDALRRQPGVRSAISRATEPQRGGGGCAWAITFVVTGDDLGREAAELVRMCVQEATRVQIREIEQGRTGTTFWLRGLSESRPAELAVALQAAGRLQFERLRNF
jgi:hypothetical protein